MHVIRFRHAVRLLVAVLFVLTFASMQGIAGARSQRAAPKAATAAECQLNSPSGNAKHVIFIQFDNVHYRRDNPNVPSDIQQMPNLLNFFKNKGTFLTNEHTPLIAHTADDILTSLTGVYGDRHGQPVANSFDYFQSNGVPSYYGSSFKYWTDQVDPPGDSTYNLLDAQGKNAPAPWVPFTRAGCNVGAVSIADMELENVTSDISNVWGPNSTEAQEAAANKSKAEADFEGLAVHCAAGSAVCSSANGGTSDVLPQEPGGYSGYQALFGAKFINPYLTNGGTTVNDLNGQPITNGTYPGFPGFDPTAAQSLAYTADLQEHGVPVTYTYVSDTHDANNGSGPYGPGEPGYVAQNEAYNVAFGKFFKNLSQHGITKNNTLFVVTADEGDHFVGSAPTNPGCNGITVACKYSHVGEIDADMQALLQSQFGITTPFDIHYDSAPVFYLNNQPPQTSDTTRTMERAVGKLTATSPITGKTDKLTRAMADQAEMRLLHMITADPQRDPTFTDFGNPNYYFQIGSPASDCPGAPSNVVVCEGTGYAWNHGDLGPHIDTTFLGFVGPGVKHLGIDGNVWTDHTDIRPTMLSLVGLQDDYSHQGRVITEILKKDGMNATEVHDSTMLRDLGAVYKQINAPVGRLSLDTVHAATKAMESGTTANDSEYGRFDREVSDLRRARNDLALHMEKAIEGAEFHGHPLSSRRVHLMIDRGRGLLAWGQSMRQEFS